MENRLASNEIKIMLFVSSKKIERCRNGAKFSEKVRLKLPKNLNFS
jgi:hypothetical protein